MAYPNMHRVRASRFSAASVFSSTLTVTCFSHENNQMRVDTPNESWESQLSFGVSKSIWRFSWKKRQLEMRAEN